jgi:hypothetical protein
MPTECRVYHNSLLKYNSQTKFDYLKQSHTLKITEDDRDRSWEFPKILKYSDEKGVDGNTSHNYLVEWNDMNKRKSWVNFFALSLRNSLPNISFACKKEYLENMHFCHLIQLMQYCKSKPSIIIAKIQKD